MGKGGRQAWAWGIRRGWEKGNGEGKGRGLGEGGRQGGGRRKGGEGGRGEACPSQTSPKLQMQKRHAMPNVPDPSPKKSEMPCQCHVPCQVAQGAVHVQEEKVFSFCWEPVSLSTVRPLPLPASMPAQEVPGPARAVSVPGREGGSPSSHREEKSRTEREKVSQAWLLGGAMGTG